MSGRQVSQAWRTASFKSTASRSKGNFLEPTRLGSRRSSISLTSSSTFRRIIAMSAQMAGGRLGFMSIAPTAINTGLSGVRSSWLSAARKLSLARLAASAIRLASRNCFSVCFRSVMSRATLDAPIIRPALSLTGETVSEMLSRRPSLVWRSVSK